MGTDVSQSAGGRSGGRVNKARRGKRGENEGKRVGGKGPKSALKKL